MPNFVTVPLPHDLPENWKDTQYVSPGGVEVGLTSKHGYNYLMKQVNNAQQAAAELSEGADLMVGVNMLDNWYLVEPVDRRDGEVVDAEVEYFRDTALTIVAGQLQAPTYARSVDSVYGRVTINGEAFYVNASDIFEGHIASSAGAYCFDRWYGENCMMTRFRGATEGVILRPTSSVTGATMRQYIVNPKRLAGKTVTVSLLANGASEGSMLYLYKASNTLTSSMVQISAIELHNGMNKLTITLPSDVGGSTYPYFAVGMYAPLEGYIQIEAIKLELGGYQTLAHERMPGNWVLNEIPNKVMETVKCNGAPITIGGIGMIASPEDIGLSTANVLASAMILDDPTAPKKLITEVDYTGFVRETVFPYSGAPTAGNRWSNNTYMNVVNPTFYDTLPVTVYGENVNLPVKWVSENYDSTKPGEYTFTAVVEGYKWADGVTVPTIKVTVIDGVIANGGGLWGLVTSSGESVDFMLKPSKDGVTNPQIYDATGCNKMFQFVDKDTLTISSIDASYKSISNAVRFVAGRKSTTTGISGKTPYTSPTEGTNIITVEDVSIGLVAGGNANITHTGDIYITVRNATMNSNSDGKSGVYGGGYSVSGASADVTGNAHIDVSGKVNVTTIQGGGIVYDEKEGSANLNGTAYVTIHDLEEGSAITSIARGTAKKLVVNLDDSSKSLLSSVVTDDNTEIYINGQIQ